MHDSTSSSRINVLRRAVLAAGAVYGDRWDSRIGSIGSTSQSGKSFLHRRG
jgi:hypothetical protein